MKKLLILSNIALTSLLFTACSQKAEYVDFSDPQNQKAPITMALSQLDFEKAAQNMTQNLLESGALNKRGGGRYVVAIDHIINDTTQHIDTDLLIKKIRIAMLRSGKAVVSGAIAADRAESSLSTSVRKLRDNEEVKRTSIAKKNAIIAPELGLSGKIIQRNARTIDNKQLVTYVFQLSLTLLESGLNIWEDEATVGKKGSSKSVSW